MIVKYVVKSSRLLSDDITTSSEEHKLLLMPLMWVSSNLRYVACSHFYWANTVVIGGDTFVADASQYSSSHPLCRFYRSTHCFARELNIVVSKPDIFTGQALHVISQAPFTCSAFPLARKLRFSFYCTHEQK
ncbi:hypothetical protein GGI20_004319 [Coemansia sp. BCRC 34301]|nr:hypothetical protein GGI20_004319 [Coemansia sp. BCRC 34301]